MNLQNLKDKIDNRHEHDEFKKKFEFKKKELKRKEAKKIFSGFKSFFKKDGHFKFKENEHSIVAEYKEHGIKLDMDIYKHIDSADFNLEGTIKTFEKVIYNFIAEGICNKELSLLPPDISEEEKLQHDTQYYKDFTEDTIFYTFAYKIIGRNDVYISMEELMQEL